MSSLTVQAIVEEGALVPVRPLLHAMVNLSKPAWNVHATLLLEQEYPGEDVVSRGEALARSVDGQIPLDIICGGSADQIKATTAEFHHDLLLLGIEASHRKGAPLYEVVEASNTPAILIASCIDDGIDFWSKLKPADRSRFILYGVCDQRSYTRESLCRARDYILEYDDRLLGKSDSERGSALQTMLVLIQSHIASFHWPTVVSSEAV